MLLREGTHMLALFLSWLHADLNTHCVGNAVLISLPMHASQIRVSWENTELDPQLVANCVPFNSSMLICTCWSRGLSDPGSEPRGLSSCSQTAAEGTCSQGYTMEAQGGKQSNWGVAEAVLKNTMQCCFWQKTKLAFTLLPSMAPSCRLGLRKYRAVQLIPVLPSAIPTHFVSCVFRLALGHKTVSCLRILQTMICTATM